MDLKKVGCRVWTEFGYLSIELGNWLAERLSDFDGLLQLV